jgi:hypothetical protein
MDNETLPIVNQLARLERAHADQKKELETWKHLAKVLWGSASKELQAKCIEDDLVPKGKV